MRTFIGVVGLLSMILGGLFGLVGAAVVTTGYHDPSVECAERTGIGTVCRYPDYYASPSAVSRYGFDGLGFLVAGAGLFVGGCALVAGHVVSGRLDPRPQPAVAGGPPSYAGPPSPSVGPPSPPRSGPPPPGGYRPSS